MRNPALSAVPDPDPNERLPAGLTTFQGKAVKSAKMSLTSTAKLECDDREVKIDDIVRLVVEGRVTGVHYDVDEQSGDLIRIQRVKVIDVEFSPWDPDDPTDDGVQR